jgi:hypothetical protein
MKKYISAIFVLILISSALSAQTFAIGPQVGFVKSIDADNTTLMPGLAVRLNLLGFGIEGSMYYKSEEFQNGAVKTKSYPINLTAMFHLLPIIHGEVGVGWYNTQIDFSNPISSIKNETKNNAGYHLGVGTQIPLGNIYLTGDLRYVFLDISSVASFKSNFYVVMVGAMIGF